MKYPRAAITYRAARRNLCLKAKCQKGTPRGKWGPQWYFSNIMRMVKERSHAAIDQS